MALFFIIYIVYVGVGILLDSQILYPLECV